MTDYTKAACRGYEYTFDDAIPGKQHGRVSGLWERDAQARALTLCEGCPLRVACLKDYWRDPWVVAGGTTAYDRSAHKAAAPRPNAGTCVRGHDVSTPNSRNGSRRCRVCAREDQQARSARARA